MKHNLFRRMGLNAALFALSVAASRAAFAQVTISPAAPPTAPPTTAKATIPGPTFPLAIQYRFWRGLPAVDGLVNGNYPAQFVLDTGLSANTLTPQDADRLQITKSPAKVHVTALDRTADTTSGTIQTVKFGANILKDIPVAEMDVASLLSHGSVPDAPAGWLGTPWLSSYQVTFDFVTRLLVLNRRDAPFEKLVGSIVPFKLKAGRPVIKVSVPGAGSFDAVLDTGAIGTLIPAAIAAKLKIKPTETLEVTQSDGTTGKMMRVVIPRIEIGKEGVTKLTVAAYSPSTTSGAADRQMAIIGIDFLRHFHVTISYAKLQVQISAPKTVKGPSDDGPN